MARIVVVEDNASSLKLMTYLLAASGHQVESCRDGRAGLETMRRSPPDLALCDIQLPGLSGYEIVRAARADPLLRELPVIAVTALAMPGDDARALAAGFDGYIAKPIDPRTFAATVASFVPPRRE